MATAKDREITNADRRRVCKGLAAEQHRLEAIRKAIVDNKEMAKEVKEITKYINGIARLKRKFEKAMILSEGKKRK